MAWRITRHVGFISAKFCSYRQMTKHHFVPGHYRSSCTLWTTSKPMSGDTKGVSLSEIVGYLERLADPSFAEPWDNVGLLIEPSSKVLIKHILFTNDLTEDVMDEAVENEVNLIVSYHPPIFAALKKITSAHWKERIVAKCLENRIAVYSPHTAWDAVHGGVTDWLLSMFREYLDPSTVRPIQPGKNQDNLVEERSAKIGMGRIFEVQNLSLNDIVLLVKVQTGVDTVRLALARGKTKDSNITTVALVPGSGGSLLKGITPDLFITGEMFHHDILEANHNGTSVILTNHSDSERGFLTVFSERLMANYNNLITITISKSDKDPIITV